MADINTSMEILGPIIGPLTRFIDIIQYIVGGIFGIYLILVILRWYESRKLVRLMTDVKQELKSLNKHLGVKTRKQKTTSIRKIRKTIKNLTKTK